MATRIFWSEDECLLLLNLIEEKNILKLIDGKKYRRKEIFKVIYDEFVKRGITDKNEIQLDTKWKNLKKPYIAAKKENDISGNNTTTCDYYDYLDRILGSRPSIKTVSQGIDAAQIQSENIINQNEIDGDVECSNEQSDAEPMPKKRKERVSRKCQLEIDKMNEEFLKNQKSALDQELKMFAEQEAKQNREFLTGMREILLETNQMFITEIHSILSGDPSSITTKTSTNTSNTTSMSPGNNDILDDQPSTSTTTNTNLITPDTDLENDLDTDLENELSEFIKF